MKYPIVSVVMPTFNRQKYLDEAIESITNQTFKDFEFVIVDDSSTDNSVEIIRKHLQKDHRIRLLKNQYKKGIVGALNTAIEAAKGKYIARMDSDDVSLPQRLEKQVQFLESHPEIGACGTWVRLFGMKEGAEWHLATDPETIQCTMLFCGAIANPTGMFRREVFFDLGFMYDPDFVVAEDFDFWTRISEKVKMANIPEVLLRYRTHGSNSIVTYSRQHLQMSSKIRLRQLRRLGISPTWQEAVIHRKIGNGEYIGGKKAMKKVDSWADKLIEANKKTKIFPEPAFLEVVWQKKKEAHDIYDKNRERLTLLSILNRTAGLGGRVLRLFLPEPTVDNLRQNCFRLYKFLQEKRAFFSDEAEKLRIKYGRITRLAKKVPEKFKIGFAILAHERPEYLEICLDSLFRTNLHDYDITFLISDDGSKDPRVKDIIEKQRDPKYKIVRYFTPKGHNSWAAAFNKAMRKLITIDDFDIIGSADSDCLFHPEWLDRTLKIALWAKKTHKNNVLGPFSSFNSNDFKFHRILGIYESPFGKYVVKERMGALNYLYFKDDFLKLGYYPESKDDETLMTKKFRKMKVRYFCTETSFVEHLGRISILDQWRPKAIEEDSAFSVKPALGGWKLPKDVYDKFPFLRHHSLILQIKYGGLGDHLFYSHLPRIAKELGYKKVYISNFSDFRNPIYKKLIWEPNPYVDGFCDEKGYYPIFKDVEEGTNILDRIMLEQGLDDGKRFHEPELYYQPKIRQELVGKNIFDPNYISNAGKLSSATIEKYFKDNNVRTDYQMKLRDNSIPLKRNIETLSTETLEEFCDAIASCGRMYCLTTGTATLAAALGKKSTVFYGDGVGRMFHHSKLHQYIHL